MQMVHVQAAEGAADTEHAQNQPAGPTLVTAETHKHTTVTRTRKPETHTL